jgi:formate dehydrogenase
MQPSRRWRLDPYASPDEHYALVSGPATPIPERVLSELEQGGLRGMGGAGFPTGKKWSIVRAETATPKFVVCNADESEPGTFKDRVILAELPHLVLEGMLLAARVVDAERTILYVRHEYEPERRVFERELARARDRGVPGAEAVEVFVSPGGYILGEETALLEALEDRRGEPRNKPPFPGQRGLEGKPTLINNVETLAAAVAIVRRGAAWWREQGRSGAVGLKLMAVSGDVERPGVYEIAAGTPVAELIETAGGVSGGRPLLAFLPGGASSNFLPASAASTPIDFDALVKAGSMLGSGALIVLAEGRDLLDAALSTTRFFRNESCGKCVPCRVGTEKAVHLLAK